MNKNILVISNMYPSNCNQQYGIFVKQLHEKISGHGFLYVTKSFSKNKAAIFFKYLWMLFRTIFYSLKFKSKIKVIHVHYGFPTGLLGLIAKKITHAPMLVTLHGSDVNGTIPGSGLKFSLFKKILKHSDLVNPVSQDLADKVQKYFDVEQKKIFVCNMGVNLAIFSCIQDARSKLNIEKNKTVLLFVGSLTDNKNPMEFISIFEEFNRLNPNSEAHIVGEGEMFDACFSYIKANTLSGSCKLHGREPLGKVALWMSAADFLVIPSKNEGFGLVALEGQACGSIVFANAVGGLNEVITDQLNGFHFHNGESHQTALLMFNLLKDQNKIQQIKEAGFNSAKNNSIEETARKFSLEYVKLGVSQPN